MPLYMEASSEGVVTRSQITLLLLPGHYSLGVLGPKILFSSSSFGLQSVSFGAAVTCVNIFNVFFSSSCLLSCFLLHTKLFRMNKRS